VPGRRQGTPLANPEARWERPAIEQGEAEAEARRRLGDLPGPVTPLSGGLANLVLRIGDDRVLRIYRRDATSIDKELALLQRPWRTFRVPQVLARGGDHLLLDHVPHAPLEDDAASGAALGATLAEIHATRLPQHGFIDGNLRVVEPMPDFVDALVGYARENLNAMGAHRASGDAAFTALRTAIATLDERRGDLERVLSGPVLLHGDFKVSNLRRADDGSLLVLDWEFAFAGPTLCDIGQLLRWQPSAQFEGAFAEAYRAGGGVLRDGWRRAADTLDLANLVGLIVRGRDDGGRVTDLVERIRVTVAAPPT
jgi:aminoglycoside phosphotransferase (APT) family kinase protein